MARASGKSNGVGTASDRTLRRAAQSRTITDAEIGRRAFDLYLARGCEDGYDVADWLQAERELNGSTVADPDAQR